MDFRLLGPFEAHHDGVRVEVGSRRQERCLLAILLLHADRLVPIDRLIDLLWDGAPPRAARGVVHTYIGRLRATLGAYQLAITTRGDGYLVESGTHTTDVARFTDLAHRAAGTTDLGERVDRYDEALALWRGPLLADIADDRLRQRLGADLTELWLSSCELRAEAQLELGRYDLVVTGLTTLVDRHPTRERLVAALMTALHRTGRQDEALRLYRATRHRLVRDLGVEPGPDLRRLHTQILRNDPQVGELPLPVYAVRVRGQVLPWSVGGHPALEFCNTYAGWGGPRLARGEWLRSYTSLAVWAGYMDLADEATVTRLIRQGEAKPAEAAAVLDEARVLREHLYAYLLNPDDQRSFAVVARFVEAAAKHSVFIRDADGLGRWRLARNTGLRLPLHAAARAAADLLADPRRFTVRACPGKHCGWLFLDQSGLRKYCSLVTCGKIAQTATVCAST
jgi:DNA-binding SARP family transcriptional activator/predicted RNA-binding Zn ribbon-like protein